MSRMVRWGLITIVLLVAVVLVLPFVLPSSVYKSQIVKATREGTGRDLVIDGDLSVSFWPTLGVVANTVRFANAPGAAAPDMVTMDSLVIGAELFPLLSGTLSVTEIKLVNPVINLEVDANGRGNWILEEDEGSAAPPELTVPAPSGNFSFRDVAVTGGVVTYRDARSGTTERIEAINALVKLPGLEQPMNFSGALTWNNEAITLTADVANLLALSTSGKSRVTAKIEGKVLTASFAGDAGAGQVSGAVDLRTNSAQRLASWAGIALPGGRGFGVASIAGDLLVSKDDISFKNAKLSMDGMSGSGELALSEIDAKPHAEGKFALNRLDVNTYLSGSPKVDSQNSGAGVAGWSDTPIDIAPLKLVNADLDFSVDSLAAGKMQIGRSSLTLAISGGKLRANLKQLELYGGKGRGVITLDETAAGPRIGLDFEISGVQAEPFLTDAMGFQKLTGTGNVALRVVAAGRSQRGWMQSLGGTAQIRFADGSIKGINLAEIARTISSALTGTAVGSSATTDFSELSGSYVIKDGVAANKDLKLLGPFVRMDGAGLIDIGRQSMDYRVAPRAVASAEGQGGKQDLAGLGIPFRIKGPWRKLSYEPDLSGIANSAVDAILKGKNPLNGLKEDGGLGDFLSGIGGKKSTEDTTTNGATPPTKTPEKENKVDPLKDILGGGQ